MKNLILKSNQGNHRGFNRKWSVEGEFQTKAEAREALVEISFTLSDNIINRNQRAYDLDSEEYVYVNGMDGFSYDGVSYRIVTVKEAEYFFDGGSHGYITEQIEQAFAEL